MKFFYFLLYGVVIVMFTSCSGISDKCMHEKCFKDGMAAPLWVCKPKFEGKVCAIGFAERSPAGVGFQRRVALGKAKDILLKKIKESAKLQLAKVGINVDTSEYVSVKSEKTLGSLVSMELKMLKDWYNKEGEVYILVGMPQSHYKYLVDHYVKKLASANKHDYEKLLNQ